MNKILLLSLLLLIVGLSACTTLSNRRDLFSPDRPEGPYTDRLHEMREEGKAEFDPPPTSGDNLR